eukprot:TRINITY_DN59106_c0_g1_i1.p1 TRINITY_DN59106_c0_g1~~TRINITY_DN59106_c0_g1_i1.p1  ORF type:complete len:108 (-),score=10.37 TRINITY_DN59106_c0_g1_i1:135-458(-)
MCFEDQTLSTTVLSCARATNGAMQSEPMLAILLIPLSHQSCHTLRTSLTPQHQQRHANAASSAAILSILSSTRSCLSSFSATTAARDLTVKCGLSAMRTPRSIGAAS